MLLLQLLGPLRDDLPDLLVPAVKRGGKRLLMSNEVFLLGVQQSLLLPSDSFVLGGLLLHRLLGLLDVVLLQEELSLALI